MSGADDARRMRLWLEVREPLERQLRPIGEAAIERLEVRGGEHVLDIGCGIARTAERIADIVGRAGSVTGIDIMPAAIELRRSETTALPNVAFVAGDAQTFAFSPSGFDAAFSRFGTMFFADPVAAFANIARALRPGGRLVFTCWRSLVENELDAFPLHAAAPVLPVGSVAEAARADHFSFADPGFLHRILTDAGYREIEIERVNMPVSGGDLAASLSLCSRFGSLGKILRDEPRLHDGAIERLERAFLARADAGAPTLIAATWIVRAIRD